MSIEINAIRVENLSDKYSENLLPKSSLFLDEPTINVLSGSASFSYETAERYKGLKSVFCQVESYDTTDCTFNFGTALDFTARNTGSHIFQMQIMNPNVTSTFFVPFQMLVQVFVNGVNTYDFLINSIGDYEVNSKKWIGYTQSLPLDANDDVSFQFVVYADITYPFSDMNFYIDAFKVEYDDRFLNIPSAYSLPIGVPIEDVVGWAYYADSLATPTISIGTTYTQITIDKLGASTNELYLPREIRGVSSLFSANKITPISIGDDYDGRFDCTVTARTGSPTAIEFIIDISGGVAGTNKAFTGWIQAIGTAPYDQSMPLDYFALATFLTNGGRLYARVDTGTVTIGRRNIKISRKSKNQ